MVLKPAPMFSYIIFPEVQGSGNSYSLQKDENPSVTQNPLAPSPFLEFQEREMLLSHGKANLCGARCTLLSIFCRLGQRNQAKRKDTLTREISRMKEICNFQYIWLNDAITTRRITTIMAYENTALGSKVTKFLTFSFFFFYKSLSNFRVWGLRRLY